MKINTRLKIAALAPVLMALVIGLALFFSYRTMEDAQEKGRIVRQLVNSANQLNSLLGQYMLHREERPRQQFLAELDSMEELIATIQFGNPEQQRLLDSVRNNTESIRDTFLRLVSNYERLRATAEDPLLQEVEERLAGQLLIRSRDVVSDALRLESLVSEEITTTQTRTSTLIFLVIIVTAVPLTIVLVWTMRSITTSLTALRQGTEVIGAGNLDHRMGMPAGDELGELARSIDRMTQRLQVVTVSKDELQQEVEERKRAEEERERLLAEVQRRAAELDAANKELEAFSYSVSHDLRAPLRHIDGFSKILLQAYADKLDERGKQYLQFLRDGSQKMDQLIDAMLKLSRATRAEMRRQPVNLSEIVESILTELRKEQPERQVELTVAPNVIANGDLQSLRIALENLLGNAWKFTSQRPVTKIEFGVGRQDGKPLYYTKDNGAGFDPRYADKLFAPFQRLHRPEEYPGTGIGLATVQRIIHRHGGRVWAEGDVDKGATFYFTLE